MTQSVDFTGVNMLLTLPSSPDGQASVAVEGVITTVSVIESQDGGRGGGAPVDARFRDPKGVVVAGDGALFISEHGGHRVWKVTPDGKMSPVAGDGTKGHGGDGGLARAAQLDSPGPLALDAEGNLYIGEDSRVRKVTPEGKITTAVDDLAWPRGLALDSQRNLYISESSRHRVRKVNLETDETTTVAGTDSREGFSGDNEPADAARLYYPAGLCVDDNDNLYIADHYNGRVRKVDRKGIITTFAGGGSNDPGDGKPATGAGLRAPEGLGRDIDGNLYIADAGGHRVRKVDRDGIITTVAGTGEAASGGDGEQATKAGLKFPYGLALDQQGTLYIADTYNDRVRRVAGPQERSLMIRQVKVPQAGLGESAELTVEITACRAGQTVDAGPVVQTFTAPTGFAFAEWPAYSYNGNDAQRGSLSSRFERDRSVMVVTSNLHLNTCTEDKGPLIYTIPVKAVTAVPPDTYHDGKLVVGRHPGIRLSGTIIEGSQFSVTPGGAPKKLVRASNECEYPGVEVRQGGPVPAQTITATLPPGAGLAFKPEHGVRHQMSVGSRGGDRTQNFDAELSDDGQTLTCQNVDLDFLQKHPNSRVWVAVTATVTAATGTTHLTFRVGAIESASTTIEVVEE
ncbi:SMP-30/gluconolactonase/LRE family protein [Streptomyces sp. NPDC032940]|uniref:NHL domain-containing protein n=1 Tax=Streptomyces sp. NPDC032940 TaxID=3155366 RepID=UPI0033F7C05B